MLEVSLCGSPGCAIGHYAARPDLQDLFGIGTRGFLSLRATGAEISPYSEYVCDHFGISANDAFRLFNMAGCGGAKTAVRAAEFIERFVAEHDAEEHP